MATIQLVNYSFTYPSAAAPVFEHVSLSLDTSWRLGLIGRNGRGKTTLLKLLAGQLEGEGELISPKNFEYFPQMPENMEQNTLALLKDRIAPFRLWEEKMEELAGAATPRAMEEYGELQHRYEEAQGYVIDELLEAEAGRLDVAPGALGRPFSTLSGGERVKLLLAAMFLKKHSFLLIDEPTDHLDYEGRKTVARWLAGKSGFILVSHDRQFIDGAVDHILAINKAGIELQRGNYSSWRHNRSLQDEYELASNKRLAGEIRQLSAAAQRTEKWSDKVEASKIGSHAADRGFIGAQAAKMMARSKAIVRRTERQMEEKQGLLKNIEETEPLKFIALPMEKKRLLHARGLALRFDGRALFEGLELAIEAGERIWLQGRNGKGKTCLLNILAGDMEPTEGEVSRFSGLVISRLWQETAFLHGSLQGYARAQGLNESLFLAILRKLNFKRESFLQPMESYSAGQKKKVCLAASLARPAHLFIWDEPLNYIDVLSREQIEAAVLEYGPTMLFVEHDGAFAEKVATRRLVLG